MTTEITTVLLNQSVVELCSVSQAFRRLTILLRAFAAVAFGDGIPLYFCKARSLCVPTIGRVDRLSRWSSIACRRLLGCACAGATGFAASAALPFSGAFAATAAGPDHANASAKSGRTALSPDEALALLRKGNADYLSEAPMHAAVGRQRRIEIAREQHPFAVLVSCSDSRVPPELLFGRGLGELFIVRNAGNTVDTVALGSIEYAVEHLGVPLVLVMGHQRCGAVAAAVSLVREHTRFTGAIGAMIEPIVPAVLEAQRQPGDLLDNAVRENVRRVVRDLRDAPEPLMAEPLKKETLKIVGAVYSLDDGSVNFFDEG